MPPTSMKLRGHIGLGLSVRLSFCLSVTLALGQEPLEIRSCNLVCGRSMEIKRTIFFFSCPAGLSLQL